MPHPVRWRVLQSEIDDGNRDLVNSVGHTYVKLVKPENRGLREDVGGWSTLWWQFDLAYGWFRLGVTGSRHILIAV